jgi:hypothetical protein
VSAASTLRSSWTTYLRLLLKANGLAEKIRDAHFRSDLWRYCKGTDIGFGSRKYELVNQPSKELGVRAQKYSLTRSRAPAQASQRSALAPVRPAEADRPGARLKLWTTALSSLQLLREWDAFLTASLHPACSRPSARRSPRRRALPFETAGLRLSEGA